MLSYSKATAVCRAPLSRFCMVGSRPETATSTWEKSIKEDGGLDCPIGALRACDEIGNAVLQDDGVVGQRRADSPGQVPEVFHIGRFRFYRVQANGPVFGQPMLRACCATMSCGSSLPAIKAERSSVPFAYAWLS